MLKAALVDGPVYSLVHTGTARLWALPMTLLQLQKGKDQITWGLL